MAHVPSVDRSSPPSAAHPLSITVYALRENPRPVGFAPWPDTDEKPKKRKKRKKNQSPS